MKSIIELLKALTWQKTVQAVILILILGITYGFWENRITVYNSWKIGARVESDSPVTMNLSPSTILLLDDTVNRMRDIIGGIQVVNVNFKKNSRSAAYFAISDNALREAYFNFESKRTAPTQLFTTNEVINQKLINLINGEFVCNDFKDTHAMKTMPGAANSIYMVCALSIPPYYGRFSGYINIYLTKKPTEDDLATIRQVSRDISFHIYETDIDKH